MSGAISPITANKLLSHLFGISTFVPSSEIDVRLSTTDPSTSITYPLTSRGYNYIITSAVDWVLSNNSITNANTLQFPVATGNWGTITHVLLTDGVTIIAYGPITPAYTVTSGTILRFPAGTLTVSI